jgi:hypothetical protein
VESGQFYQNVADLSSFIYSYPINNPNWLYLEKPLNSSIMTESARKRITIDFSGNDRRLQAIHDYLTRANLSREMTIEALVAHYLPAAMLAERGKLSDKELSLVGYQSLDRLLCQINSVIDLYSLEGLPFSIDGLARRVSFLGQSSQPLAVARAVKKAESVGDDLDDREDDDDEVVLIPPQRASNFSGLK